jgi:protocatechuate 3,4-dioxygenase beta subunit
MKRNVVLALLVVLAMALWRIHVHHTQVAMPAASELRPIVVGHVARTEPHLASLAGTVRDDAGKPIAGARVCAMASAPALPTELTREARCVTTGANGAYTISNLYAAEYQVSAMAKQLTVETYAPDGPDRRVWFPLAANEERRGVDLVLHHGGVEVSGTISDAGGGVIANAQVGIATTWQRYGATSIVVDTDEHGHYSAWTRPGMLTLTAGADGYASQLRTGTAPAQLDLVLVPEAVLSGTVVDAKTGAPVPDVTVGANASDWWMAIDTTQTDAQGHFTLSRLPPSRYTMFARAPHGTGFSEGSTAVALGQHVDGVVVKLHPAYQLVARIEAGGKPCRYPGLTLVDERQNLQPIAHQDPDGTVHVDGVLPGIYVPSPSCDGFVTRDHYDPIVVADRDVTASWKLEPGGTITGRIHTAAGAPIANADVALWSVTTAERIQPVYGTDRATRDGDYTLRGLRPGRYQLSVSLPDSGSVMGAATLAQVDVELAENATVHRDIVAPAGDGAISGRVTTARGSPGRVYIQARTPDGGTTLVASDDAGRYEFRAVTAGTYELVVLGATDHGLMDTLTTGDPTKVEVLAGKSATANFIIELPSGVIRGRVVDERGAPVADAFVGLAFEHDEAPAMRSVRGDNDEMLAGSDGRFTTEHLSKGPYTVRAYRKGSGEVIAAHVAVGSDITLVLKSTGEVTGVAHRRGSAIDDLHVAIFDRDTQDRVRDEVFFRTGGKFALHDLPAGHYQLVVSTGGSEHAAQVDLVGGQHATLDVELEGNVTLVGRAIDARTHEPVAGISVSANLSTTNGSFLLPSDLSNISDANGRFEVPNVQRGSLDIFGRTYDDGVRLYDPVTLHRTVTASDPEVVDLGDVWVVMTTADARADAGLTLEVTGEPKLVKVVGVGSDSAAGKAGIVIDDVITAIDGVDVTGDAADEARTLVTGEAGTAIVVTLERGVTVTVVLVKS